jgi:glutaredoxin
MQTQSNNVGEDESVEVFWMPGCSSCVKVKEFLAERNIAYRSANIAEQPEKLDELVARGFKGVPVVRKGDRYVHAVSLEPVSELIGVQFSMQRLSVPILMERWIDMLGQVRNIIASIPDDRLDDFPIPNRPRSLRDLAGHIFQVPEAFLQTMVEGVDDTRATISRSCANLETKQALVGYVTAILESLCDWWRGAQGRPLPDPVQVYYGSQSLNEFVERSVWHSAQHARQLDVIVAEINSSNKVLPAAIYTGLPMPKGLWE